MDRKWEIVKHAEEKIVKKKAAKEKHAENAIKKAARISQTKHEFDKETIKKTKGPELRDLVAAFKIADALNLDSINSKSKVPELKSALCDTIDLFNAGEWQFKGSEYSQKNDEESGKEEESEEEYLSNIFQMMMVIVLANMNKLGWYIAESIYICYAEQNVFG